MLLRLEFVDKFLAAEYNVDGYVDAYLFAAKLDGITTNDLQYGNGANQTADFEVASIARLTNIGQNALSALDLTVTKTNNLN